VRMTRRVSGLLLGVVAAGVAALSCKSDPTSSLATNTPATISTSVSRLVVSQGDTGAFQASVLNAQLVPLPLPVTFAAFGGPVVAFGGAIAGDNFGASATQVVVGVPFSNKARLVIDSIAPPYISTNAYELSTVDTVAQTGDFWDGDSSTTTAPLLFPMFPGDSLPGGTTIPMITNLTSGNEVAINNQPLCPDNTAQGPCLFYQFTLADTATLKVSMNWDGSPVDLTDLDVFACPAPYNASACNTSPEGVDGINHGLADAAVRPEAFTYHFPAGQHFLVIQRFQTGSPTTTVPPRNIRLTIDHH